MLYIILFLSLGSIEAKRALSNERLMYCALILRVNSKELRLHKSPSQHSKLLSLSCLHCSADMQPWTVTISPFVVLFVCLKQRLSGNEQLTVVTVTFWLGDGRSQRLPS